MEPKGSTPEPHSPVNVRNPAKRDKECGGYNYVTKHDP